MTTTMTAVCAALLGSLIVAAPAHADADSYIATLDVMGVPYRNRSAAIQFGEVICHSKFARASHSLVCPRPLLPSKLSVFWASLVFGPRSSDLAKRGLLQSTHRSSTRASFQARASAVAR
jgi:hypothetical protein